MTQWKSATTSVRGSSPNAGQSQVASSPEAVAPTTEKSHVAASNDGTGP